MDESKHPGGNQELRTSTLIRPRPIEGEGHVDFFEESAGFLPQLHDGEAMNHFWSMSGSFIFRHQSQALLAERRIIPYSTEIH